MIVWENRHKGNTNQFCKTSVDGTDFRIKIRKHFERCWWGYKFKAAGLRYEVGISIQSGDIVWTNGPFLPGDNPDITVFRKGIIHHLDFLEQVEADKGYRGEPAFARTPNGNRQADLI